MNGYPTDCPPLVDSGLFFDPSASCKVYWGNLDRVFFNICVKILSLESCCTLFCQVSQSCMYGLGSGLRGSKTFHMRRDRSVGGLSIRLPHEDTPARVRRLTSTSSRASSIVNTIGRAMEGKHVGGTPVRLLDETVLARGPGMNDFSS